jgi:hypothetical protein
MNERQRHLSENEFTTGLLGAIAFIVFISILGWDLLIGNYNYFVRQSWSIKNPTFFFHDGRANVRKSQIRKFATLRKFQICKICKNN